VPAVPRAAAPRACGGGEPRDVQGEIQALALRAPDADPASRARFLALDEPVYLHQVTGRRGGELVRALDLPELGASPERFRGCDEWRCHFHVPVHLATLGDEGLATTRGEAERTLAAALAAPERWGSAELHVEVETYTWNLFRPGEVGVASVVDGLEQELLHVGARLAAAGWTSVR